MEGQRHTDLNSHSLSPSECEKSTRKSRNTWITKQETVCLIYFPFKCFCYSNKTCLFLCSSANSTFPLYHTKFTNKEKSSALNDESSKTDTEWNEGQGGAWSEVITEIMHERYSRWRDFFYIIRCKMADYWKWSIIEEVSEAMETRSDMVFVYSAGSGPLGV